MIERTQEYFQALGQKRLIEQARLTADSGFCNTANANYLYEHGIDGYLPDLGFRKRDPHFVDVERYRSNTNKENEQCRDKKKRQYTSPEIHYDRPSHTCTCPAGKKLYSNGRLVDFNGHEVVKFRSAQRDCVPCMHQEQCFRYLAKIQTRQVSIFIDRSTRVKKLQRYLYLMKQKIDTPAGRH